MSGLTAFQADVARLFFSLPASEGFLFAAGGALLVSGLTARPTEDLDFFGERGRADIAAARDHIETAIAERGWQSARTAGTRPLRRGSARWPPNRTTVAV